ncbi:hypothetical protein D1174_02270 [Enterobacter cloacae]|uniref:hypothetical protein n=1 Tax=Enterobacter cloacae TaxID=550 RepID=UPI00122F99E3|nr:hypothetical protein [Enterobacter cloacae]KAA3579651.1 hypothetical protein D1177_03440 [Enterobacter cloacae]KAA3580894.1 hypothetical protein D1176_03115 [Enterobacter cloacae]KAA3594156.1 hypothetical protein D1175_03115 [Enterobacter cloacae]KAA3595007.1 hypothetical protein D1174_02270 [Enterobacter cloacae]
MQVDIYNSNIRKMKFLVVPAGTDVAGNTLNLTDPDFSSVALFKGDITLQHGLVGLNLVKATSDIAAQGYHIVEISVNVEVL